MKLVGGLLIDCWVGLKWLPIQEVFGGGWKVCCMGGCGLLDTGDWPTKLSSSPRSLIMSLSSAEGTASRDGMFPSDTPNKPTSWGESIKRAEV